MRRILLLFITVLLGVFIAGCGEKKGRIEEKKSTENVGKAIQEDDSQEESSDILVAYFSCTGTTEEYARLIADKTSGDVYKIVPKEPYTKQDLDFNNKNARATLEQNKDSERPEIDGIFEKIDNYNTIFVGFPIWWGHTPRIIFTFLESYNLNGKTIIPFCTSGSSGIESSEKELKEYFKDVNWKKGRRFAKTEGEAQVNEWIETLSK